MGTDNDAHAVHDEKIVLSVDETIEAAGVGRTLFYSQVKEGRIRIRKLGRRSICLREELIEDLRNLPMAAADSMD